ncbi:MAG: hypothetical protein IJR02_05630 [Bacteroidaceae bacterium]|nr:hypothetical protein [Bacteroidaceae bacterium]
MKKFLLHLFSFLMLLLLFYGFLWGRYIIKANNFDFKLAKEKTILVIGDSQTQAAVDDEMLKNVQNISMSHDGYFTMLTRLRLYVEANPQIDTVLIALSPHTLAPHKDEFYANFGYMGESTKFYLPFFSFSEWTFMIKHDAADVLSYLVTPISFYWDVNDEYREKNYGFFEVVDESHLEEDVKEGATRLKTFAADSEELAKEDSQLASFANTITRAQLRELKQYCDAKKIKLIGLNTPVYQAEHYLNIKNFNHLMSEEFQDIELWDYMDLEIADSCRRDVNHLNRNGATLFSKILAERLSQ